MPETPDFDQIADTCVQRVESHICDPLLRPSGPDDDPVRATIVRTIAEQFRQVWNARGAADAEVVRAEDADGALVESDDPADDRKTLLIDLVAALKALDR